MRDAMRRPTHPVVGVLSVMQQEAAATMRPEQRLVVDALARTGTLSSTLMDDVMERLSAAEKCDPPPLSSPRLVARRPFDLRSLTRDVAIVAGCLSGCRGLGFSHQLEAGSLPEWVVGDDRRVFHHLLQMMDTLLSRCHVHVAGRVLSFSAGGCNDIVSDDQHWFPVLARHNFSGGGGNYVFVKFQVGLRIAPENDAAESLPASRRRPPRSPGSSRADLQLNISMCKKIVQMMNGNLWLASDPEPGLGEAMNLVLRFQLQQSLNPHAGSATYGIGPSSSTIPQHNFNGPRILLADSDAVSLEVNRKLLERLGCQVVAVSSSRCCQSLLGSTGEPPFQLVVLDLDAHGAGSAAGMMNNGFEVALRIRELSSSCWLLVLVALSGSAAEDSGVRDMCRQAGVNGVIQKPITLPAMGTELQRVLQNN